MREASNEAWPLASHLWEARRVLSTLIKFEQRCKLNARIIPRRDKMLAAREVNVARRSAHESSPCR